MTIEEIIDSLPEEVTIDSMNSVIRKLKRISREEYLRGRHNELFKTWYFAREAQMWKLIDKYLCYTCMELREPEGHDPTHTHVGFRHK